jgi:geranylgeranyl pyrophosphate synthase
LRQGKVTLRLVHALERARPKERPLIETILRDRSYEQAPFCDVLALLEKYRGVERVRERARLFIDKTRDLIAGFPESPCQRALASCPT